MLSIKQCQRILNEHAPPGTAYTEAEAEQLRSVLYTIARIYLELYQADADEKGDHLQSRFYNRTSR